MLSKESGNGRQKVPIINPSAVSSLYSVRSAWIRSCILASKVKKSVLLDYEHITLNLPFKYLDLDVGGKRKMRKQLIFSHYRADITGHYQTLPGRHQATFFYLCLIHSLFTVMRRQGLNKITITDGGSTPLRHWLQFWQLRTWIHDNLCDLTVTGHRKAFAILAIFKQFTEARVSDGNRLHISFSCKAENTCFYSAVSIVICCPKHEDNVVYIPFS